METQGDTDERGAGPAFMLVPYIGWCALSRLLTSRTNKYPLQPAHRPFVHVRTTTQLGAAIQPDNKPAIILTFQSLTFRIHLPSGTIFGDHSNVLVIYLW